MTTTILQGDVRDVLATLPADHFDCIVTSPPYWGLRDYGVAGQIGLEPTLTGYLDTMTDVCRELRRVLKPEGVMFLNIGDSYFTSGVRQTGRNDTNRETPGGRGGSFRGGVRRAIVCDMPDKEPVDFQENGCFCGSLCDACRAAYRLGKSHSGGLPEPTPISSNSASIPAHTGSATSRVPMSGSDHQGGRTLDATRDRPSIAQQSGDVPRAAQASNNPESSPPFLETCSMGQSPAGGCLLCGRSLPPCAQGSGHNSACICGIEGSGRPSDPDIPGSSSSRKAYPSHTTTLLKPKDLCMVPNRLAIRLQDDGWYVRSEIIWHKPNPMPESVTDRPTSAHEKVWLLTKSERYVYDADAVREDAIKGAAGSSFFEGKTGVRQQGRASVMERKEGDFRNLRNVWTIASQPFSGAHFATMPPDLVDRCIKAGCPAGGMVLDPFGGAGTTGLAADRLGRHATLIELNPAYIEIARRRIEGDAPLFAEVLA